MLKFLYAAKDKAVVMPQVFSEHSHAKKALSPLLPGHDSDIFVVCAPICFSGVSFSFTFHNFLA